MQMVNYRKKCKGENFVGLLLFLFFNTHLFAQIKVATWNLKDFGVSKTEVEVKFISTILKDFDVIAIQEVVVSEEGVQAVRRLKNSMNCNGQKWECVISNPTSGNSYKSERYAFIWNVNRVKKEGGAWLEKNFDSLIDREPFYQTFNFNGKAFTLVNYHAITKSMQPETEIKYFKYLPEEYKDLNLIFCGDFNCPQSHSVFNPLKSDGYMPVITNQKTTLRQKCISSDCLASEFDNIFYNTKKVIFTKSGVVHFYRFFSSLKIAHNISDHLPVYFYFELI